MEEKYNSFEKLFADNKDIVKDNAYATLVKFMSIFKSQIFSESPSEIDEQGNCLDFIFDKMLSHVDEANHQWDSVKEYLNLIFLHFSLEQTQNSSIITNFFHRYLQILTSKTSLSQILVNFKLFKKIINFAIKALLNISSTHKDDLLKQLNQILALTNPTDSNEINHKQKVINFIIYICLFSYKQLNDFQVTLDPSLLGVLFDLNIILKFALPDTPIQSQQMQKIQNNFNYLFNKHFFAMKSANPTQFDSVLKYFIDKISEEPVEEYENYVYIISDLMQDKNQIKNGVFLKAAKKILISNNGTLHKICVNALNNIEDHIDKDFLKKFIPVFDVLDGFNSHLFKSLHNELDFVIKFIDQDTNTYQMNEDGYFFKSDPSDFFSVPLNYFIFLSRKIFNHDNSRIQKYFIKTISHSGIKNPTYGNYLTSDFLEIINSPILYPENELVIYHSKMGLIIQKFFLQYFTQNFDLLFNFIIGISKRITNRRIFSYLMNTIRSVISERNDLEPENVGEVIKSIESIIDNQMKTFSYFNKNSYWVAICELVTKLKFNEKESESGLYDKVFTELINYILNWDNNLLSVDYLYFGEDKCDELFMKALNLMYNYIKSKYTFTQTIPLFITNNKLEMVNNDIVRVIYFTLALNDNIDYISEYFDENAGKIFSDYLDKEAKQEILKNLNQILILVKIWKKVPSFSEEAIADIYSTMKNYLTSKNFNGKSTEFVIENFGLYEKILFLYIELYKKPNEDLLINAFDASTVSEGKNAMIYTLKYTKMILFNFLSSIHYGIYNDSNNIKLNQTLKKNISSLYSEFIQFTSNPSVDGILLIKNISLCMIFMNYLNIPIESFGNTEDIFGLFDIGSSEDLFYIFKYFNIFFVHSNSSELFSDFIEKGIKVLTEKRDNFTYVNVLTFINTLFTKNHLKEENFINVIQKAIVKFINLNDNRIWLLLKVSTEILINHIKEDISLIDLYGDILIRLSTTKESRGEDALLLNTSPSYIKSPFNLNVKKILPFNEDIAKYGLYVRFGIMKFFEDAINSNNLAISTSVLLLISKLVHLIDANSAAKPEMQFTDKHRQKLRYSQFLLCLSSIFSKGHEFYEKAIKDSKEIIEAIEKSLFSLLTKINLYSVDFYVYQFTVLFCKYSENTRKVLLNYLTDPKTKAFIVTASLIISSIGIIEGTITEKEEIEAFSNAITVQCTSNICNIRGFAQYFINKITSVFTSVENNYLSQSFLAYLRQNPNIQKFFKKFDVKYQTYISMLENFSLDTILKNNFDEIYNEIIPMDLNNEFRVLSGESMILDNQDYTKASSSWRFVFTDEKDMNIAQDAVDDFQKKYRPIDLDIYRNITRKRLDVVIVASLVDKLPNLGGLARTCEVFNIGAMTIGSETVLNDTAFLSAASSAERWMPLISVPPSTIKEFIVSYKKLGYTIIGLEQTQNSIEIKKYKFKEKCVIVLGNEKEGIPQDIINLIDNCVVIPQYGEVRSLNVHVSAALMIWEVVNSILNN